MEAILSLALALLVFVPAAFFYFGKKHPDGQPEAPAAQDAGDTRVDVDVDVTVVRRSATLARTAITYVKNVVAGGGRPEIEPGRDGERGPDGPPPGGGEGDGEDLGDVADPVDVPGGDVPPPLQVDVERVPADPGGGLPDPAELPPAREALPPAPALPGAGDVDAPAAPAQIPVPPDDPTPPRVVDVVDDAPILELEGVDMSEAPLEISADGTAARLPTLEQMQSALATGGLRRLVAWLRQFRKASATTLDLALDLHQDAMAIARRTRNAYILALQALQAVQHDRLDRATIGRMLAVLQQCEREAVQAAQTTHHTAALVVAAGGLQPTVAAAIHTLQRKHGGIAAAVEASGEPVPNMRFYQN